MIGWTEQRVGSSSKEVRRARGVTLLMLAGVTSAWGCAGDGGSGADPWVEDTHVQVVGAIGGESLDLDLDPVVAMPMCTLEYAVPEVEGQPDYASGYLVEVKLNAWVTIDNELRLIELELKEHDFQADAVGDVSTIVPRNDLIPPASDELWLEWEWHDANDDTYYESAAQTGTVTLELYEGTPDSTGLVIPSGEGRIGVSISAQWSASEFLDITFTADCTETNVVFIQ